MLLRRASSFLILITVFSFCAFGQRNRGDRPPAPASSASPAEQAKPAGTPAAETKKEQPEQAPIVTHHEIHVGGKTLHYTATTGMMPLKNNDTGEVEAHIFFIAYTLDGQNEHRPLQGGERRDMRQHGLDSAALADNICRLRHNLAFFTTNW